MPDPTGTAERGADHYENLGQVLADLRNPEGCDLSEVITRCRHPKTLAGLEARRYDERIAQLRAIANNRSFRWSQRKTAREGAAALLDANDPETRSSQFAQAFWFLHSIDFHVEHSRATSQLAPPQIRRTPHRARSSKIHGAAQRASARSGDSGDSDDPPGEPPASCCEQCGAELIWPAKLCGFCLVELGLKPAPRECRICSVDISHRNSGAETCNDAHKKALQRRKKAQRVVVPLSVLAVDPFASVDVDPEIWWCVYGNRGVGDAYVIEAGGLAVAA